MIPREPKLSRREQAQAWRVLLETHDHRIKESGQHWFGLCASTRIARERGRLTLAQHNYLAGEIQDELVRQKLGAYEFLVDDFEFGPSDLAVIIRLMWCDLMARAAKEGL